MAEIITSPSWSSVSSNYRMEGSSADAKGAVNGSDTSMTYVVGGKFGSYANFSGTGYISLGANYNFERTSSFSISLWFNKGSTSGEMIGKQNSAAPFNGWYLASFAGGPLRWGMTGSDGSALYGDIASAYEDNLWHHFVGTYSGSQTSAGLLAYIDGKPVSLSYATGIAANIANAFNCQLGARNGGNFIYTGRLDDVGIWSGTVLTPQNVSYLFQTRALSTLGAGY